MATSFLHRLHFACCFLVFILLHQHSSYGLPHLDSSHSSSNTIQSNIIHNNTTSTIFPYFDFNVPRNITTAVGQSAFLHCRVEQLGDKAVSWIRKRDLHILTAGVLTYTSDQRFQVIRPDRSENWTLLIKFPQERDSGIYECQVNTEPKMSLAFRLSVIEPKARILGAQDLYVKIDSSITLICEISQGPHSLGTVQWYKGLTPITSSPPRVTVDASWSEGLSSRLHISHVIAEDSGNYSCVPTTRVQSDSVYIHVINGEHPAAMQHGNRCTVSKISFLTVISALGVYYFLNTMYHIR